MRVYAQSGASKFDFHDGRRLIDYNADYLTMLSEELEIPRNQLFAYETLDYSGEEKRWHGTGRITIAYFVEPGEGLYGRWFITVMNVSETESPLSRQEVRDLHTSKRTRIQRFKAKVAKRSGQNLKRIKAQQDEIKDFGKYVKRKVPDSRIAHRLSEGRGLAPI